MQETIPDDLLPSISLLPCSASLHEFRLQLTAALLERALYSFLDLCAVVAHKFFPGA